MLTLKLKYFSNNYKNIKQLSQKIMECSQVVLADEVSYNSFVKLYTINKGVNGHKKAREQFFLKPLNKKIYKLRGFFYSHQIALDFIKQIDIYIQQHMPNCCYSWKLNFSSKNFNRLFLSIAQVD